VTAPARPFPRLVGGEHLLDSGLPPDERGGFQLRVHVELHQNSPDLATDRVGADHESLGYRRDPMAAGQEVQYLAFTRAEPLQALRDALLAVLVVAVQGQELLTYGYRHHGFSGSHRRDGVQQRFQSAVLAHHACRAGGDRGGDPG
jgi:hypothetical protein